jgi:mediator of RNA polymerase II transcription subunit 10
LHIPPDIIDYVDEGRNPDIYTREFVELVQKLNQFLKGKSEAFAGFRDVLAEEMMKSMPEMKDDITKVLEGREERENMQENGI